VDHVQSYKEFLRVNGEVYISGLVGVIRCRQLGRRKLYTLHQLSLTQINYEIRIIPPCALFGIQPCRNSLPLDAGPWL
jgi:hypothetical protein